MIPMLTDAQKRIVNEIQRIAKGLGQDYLSQDQFDEHHELGGVSTAGYQFGAWNEAVKAAGLNPLPSGASNRERRYSDDELLMEIIQLHKQLGRPPSERLLAARGNFSPAPYRERWGSFSKAKEAAYERFKSQTPT